MDIELPKVPCHVISVDVEDIIGSHVVDLEGTLKKYVTDSKGKVVEILKIDDHSHDTKEVLQKTTEAMDMGYGCTLKGSIIVNKINGNFHISSHAYAEAVMILYAQRRMLDFSHNINHLSFGKEEDISKITKITGGYNLSPLDKIHDESHPKDMGGHVHNMMTTYYLDITPTKYLVGNEEEYSAHEYSYTYQTIATHGMPSVFFKYELSPIFVNYKVTQTPFFVFFIRLWAIVGGVYTVAGIIENLFLDTVDTLNKNDKKVYERAEGRSSRQYEADNENEFED